MKQHCTKWEEPSVCVCVCLSSIVTLEGGVHFGKVLGTFLRSFAALLYLNGFFLFQVLI